MHLVERKGKKKKKNYCFCASIFSYLGVSLDKNRVSTVTVVAAATKWSRIKLPPLFLQPNASAASSSLVSYSFFLLLNLGIHKFLFYFYLLVSFSSFFILSLHLIWYLWIWLKNLKFGIPSLLFPTSTRESDLGSWAIFLLLFHLLIGMAEVLKWV